VFRGGIDVTENAFNSVIVESCWMSCKLAEFCDRKRDLGSTGDHGPDEFANTTSIAEFGFKSFACGLIGWWRSSV
jgi:hypothetical protein